MDSSIASNRGAAASSRRSTSSCACTAFGVVAAAQCGTAPCAQLARAAASSTRLETDSPPPSCVSQSTRSTSTRLSHSNAKLHAALDSLQGTTCQQTVHHPPASPNPPASPAPGPSPAATADAIRHAALVSRLQDTTLKRPPSHIRDPPASPNPPASPALDPPPAATAHP